MIVAVVIFMVGLVSEQVAQLRFDRAEHFDSHQGNQTEIRKHKDRS